MADDHVTADESYDVIGIGFGPSNLALGIALADSRRSDGLRHLFLERKPEFGCANDSRVPKAESDSMVEALRARAWTSGTTSTRTRATCSPRPRTKRGPSVTWPSFSSTIWPAGSRPLRAADTGTERLGVETGTDGYGGVGGD